MTIHNPPHYPGQPVPHTTSMTTMSHTSGTPVPAPPHQHSTGASTSTSSQQQPTTTGQPSNPMDSFRPLNVRDALSYLDQVKLRFGHTPDIYNQFLDIMKEFKSQAIDTPGVIDRVSTLFRGHAGLIVGFNTFLPPGYRIDVTGNPNDPVRVTMPPGVGGAGGVVSQSMGGHASQSLVGGSAFSSASQQQQQQQKQQQMVGPSQHAQPPPPQHTPTHSHGASSGNMNMHLPRREFYPYQGPPPTLPPLSAITHPLPHHLPHVHGHGYSHGVPSGPPPPPPQNTGSGGPYGRYPPHMVHGGIVHGMHGMGNVPQQVPVPSSSQQQQQQQQQQPQQVQVQPSQVTQTVSQGVSQHVSQGVSQGVPQGGNLNTTTTGGVNGPPPPPVPPIQPTQPPQQQQPSRESQPPQPASTPQSTTPTTGTGTGEPRRGPVEFNHAINYVNKIKNRFNNDPDTYKQFLEILQTYQKDARPIQEVYAQVRVLFKGAPDLLDEFKQFLPDTSAGVVVGNVGGGSGVSTVKGGQQSVTSIVGSVKKTVKRSNGVQGPSGNGLGNMYPSTYGVPNSQVVPPKKKVRVQGTSESSPIMMHAAPPIVSSITSSTLRYHNANTSPSDELEFFDKCKRIIGNKHTYNEFLKTLNLFSQEIIDAKTLVERVEPFLSHVPDVMEWFKRFVGYDDDDVVYNVPADRPDIDLQRCRRSGHSYRKLPRDVPRAVCSGRDELSKTVLNDDWISHPVYVSETGFVSHKKTVYEESMYKVEEERYEFDLNIESNLYVIGVLEPVARKLSMMSSEEKMRYRAPSGFGGSVALLGRVIKKVYDRERGAEVLEAMMTNPAVSVPVVLKRLKQKDEEWKRCQREWNKVWRDLDNKNFAKSLDHQGIHFKSVDKKSIHVKSLVTEIEILHREQREKRSSGSMRYQFDFGFKKCGVYLDVYKIVMRGVEAGIVGMGEGDEERIREFMLGFVRKFFMIEDMEGFEEELEEGNEVSEVVSGRNFVGISEGNGNSIVSGGVPVVGSIVGGVVAVGGESVAADGGNQVTTDEEKEKKEEDVVMEVDEVVPSSVMNGVAVGESVPENKGRRSSYILYGNTAIYAFMRFYQMLFGRLLRMRELSEEMEGEMGRSEMRNPIAVEMGLQGAGERGYSTTRYEELIQNILLFVGNEMDCGEFEDRSRGLFWTSGYLVFTIDRLVQAMVKQMQIITGDRASVGLLQLFERERERESVSARAESLHRMAAEQLVEDNLYRIEWFLLERVVTIQLVLKDDSVGEDSVTSEERWSVYVDQFVQLSSSVSPDVSKPFLIRNLPKSINDNEHVIAFSGLELKICVNTYKLFFVDNTEDVFYRKRSPTNSEKTRSLKLDWKKSLSPDQIIKMEKDYRQWIDGEESEMADADFERLVEEM